MEEQQQIIWYRTNDPDPTNTWREGVLVVCDPDIGINIVDKADPDFYVCCLLGPLSPQWRARAFTVNQEQRMLDEVFRPTYKLWSGMIANGFWNSQIDDIQNPFSSGVGDPAQVCPFGQ